MPAQPAPIPPFPDDLPVASIHEVDFSALRSGSPTESRKVFEASTGYGFFYLTNHAIDHAFMFDLAAQVFGLPQSEKDRYDMGSTGHYFGYKRSGSMFVDDRGTPDQSEFYNISKDEVLGVGKLGENPSPQPDVVTARNAELEGFMRQCHEVVTVLVRVLGQQLGLPDGLLESLHRIDRPSVCQARVTHAPPVSEETVCLGEHTDFGSVTVLFNTLGGLQVLAPKSPEFHYVRPRPDSAIINLGDALIKLCGSNRLCSAVHRVLGPPGAQAQSDRHSVVYFARPNSEVLLRDLFEDPEGTGKGAQGGEALMNADDWVKQRARNWNTANYRGKESYGLSRGTEHNA